MDGVKKPGKRCVATHLDPRLGRRLIVAIVDVLTTVRNRRCCANEIAIPVSSTWRRRFARDDGLRRCVRVRGCGLVRSAIWAMVS